MRESSSRLAAGILLACVLMVPIPARGACPPTNDCFRGPNCTYIGDGTTCTVDACGAGGNGVCGFVIGSAVKQCIRQPGANSCAEVQCQTSSCPLPPGCDRPGDCIRQGTCVFTPTPGVACFDGNQCTANDVCSANGTCTPGTPIEGCQPCSSPGQCDDGNPCTTDTCPAGTCQHGPAVGVVCRAAAGVCDVAETCTAASTQCPPDAFLPSSTVCRESAGVCDVAETCTGSSADCPADTFAPNTAVCRQSAGICDVAETCTGNSADCPPNAFAPNTTVCRASAGTCDVAETCTGNSAACPADGFLPATAVCRPRAGVCDQAETCTGISAACPRDDFRPATTVCRASAGVCDVAETCTGSSASCPADLFQGSSVVCRPATGECDTPEMCSGESVQCGPDVVRPAGTECTDDGSTCTTDQCDGVAKSCEHVAQDGCIPCTSGAPCDDGNVCTVDTCEGGFCRFRPGNAGATCRDAAGPCDVVETCTGTSPTCPADVLKPSTVVCRPPAGACDAAETCTGTEPSCPVDRFEPAGTVCREAAGACDVKETCDGDGPDCPADVLAPATTVCRPAAGPCDQPESCNGTGDACPPDAQKLDGDPCDDGDPSTDTSTCQNSECRGVAVVITVPPVIDVPATQPADKVKIPVEVAAPDTGGTQPARVTAQAFVSCLDLPVANRPAQCGSPAIETLGVVTHVASGFLPVTRPRTKNLGRTQSRSVQVKLPLTKLGQKLFARLTGDEQERQLPLQITAALRDRQGRTTTAVFQSLLDRRH